MPTLKNISIKFGFIIISFQFLCGLKITFEAVSFKCGKRSNNKGALELRFQLKPNISQSNLSDFRNLDILRVQVFTFYT